MRHFYEQEKEQEINLTPMLDVVFIMLIFFIVTATFVKESGLDVNPPEPNDQKPKPSSDNILVQVAANDRIYIDKQFVDVRRLRAHFERLSAQNPEAAVVIDVHNTSSVDKTVRVMDSARAAGISAINFADK